MADEKVASTDNSTGGDGMSPITSLNEEARPRSAHFPSRIGSMTPKDGRRGSMRSAYSVDESRGSIRSTADALLDPRPAGSDMHGHPETTNWHMAPLVFALLPAVAGMLFPNGSAVVTDVTLLALGAIFLNWSVKVPWNWYHSAQSYAIDSQDDGYWDVALDESEDEQNTATSKPNPQSMESQSVDSHLRYEKAADAPVLESAELRAHELLALLSCFLFPVAGAYLLHAIRSQLSRPSEGLVSNYNLTIFLLAAELRPTAHLFRMLQARTLYLQRTGVASPFKEPASKTLVSLVRRVETLEAGPIVNGSTQGHPDGESNNKSAAMLVTEVRRSLQPDVDALNRAVRRYEKRATLQTMQTESRLQDLEARLNDAISLAAVAAQSGQQRRQGYGATLFDWACAAIVLPLRAIFSLMTVPAIASSKAMGLGQTLIKLRRNQQDHISEAKYRAHTRVKERPQTRSTKRSS
ncbi:MAG: hypothetical protein M1816_001105 [Peltula sp. TS41687]|nr:MAG: hypothetical protein M1816_001105 [Peltula sp. TS41687]